MKKELTEGDIVEGFRFGRYKFSVWDNLYIRLKFGFKDIIYWFKKQWQKIRYGFPLEESWDFYSALCKWSLPRLKHMKASKNGFPPELTEEQWQQILTDIIWSMENYDQTVEPIYPPNYDNRSKVVSVGEKGITFEKMDDRPLDWTPVNEHAEKVQKGFDLLGKWMLYLWN